MSWLSERFKANKGFLSNALKNVSPLAFLIPGVGPAAAAGLAGAGSALGQGLSRHPSLGGALKQGLGAAGMAYTGGQGLGALKAWANPAPSISGTPGLTNMTGASSLLPNVSTTIPGSMAGAATAGAAPSGSLGSRVMGALGKVGSKIKDQPIVAGQIASGVLQARESGAQTGLEREKFDYQRRLEEDEKKKRQRTAELLAPLFQQLVQSQQTQGTPYTPFHPYGAK